MEKGDILQALRKHRQGNCVHYVIFLSMKDEQTFQGACISSDETDEADIIKNVELTVDDFEPITPQNGYTVTYGNCKNSKGKSYLCKCRFTKELDWFTDGTNDAKVVGKISDIGMVKVKQILKDAPETEGTFPKPIWEANNHPELFRINNVHKHNN